MIILNLFLNFFYVGLLSVGGGYAAIPLIQSRIVEATGLMTLEEFTDLITIAEMTPGSIAINSATFVGMRLSGVFGALMCTAGVILPSVIISLILAHFYYKYKGLSSVQHVLSILRPAVVALITSAGLSILILGLFNGQAISAENFRPVDCALFVIGLVLLRKFHINPIFIIFGTGIIGTAVYYILPLISV